MPKCIIDGREVEFTPGQKLIEVAKKAGIEIPFFCYHPGLSVVAQCRMCSVEIEKMPKIQTACSTVATDGMVVHTRSEKALHAQRSTMEFLLINHPLDCPICDKSGECDLQDNSFKYGDANSRYTEERRAFMDLDMGPVIKKNMNRCIHCTRCIRFGEEVAGIREMVALRRGNSTEITTIDGRPLETDYAGNYSDICPTGSLTLKDFRFKKRVWFLDKVPTICEGCARGCNMFINQNDNIIYRCTARENLDVNRYWICDEGRFNYHYVHDAQRLIEPVQIENQKIECSDWGSSIDRAKSILEGKKIGVLIGSDLTQEEVQLLLEFIPKSFPNSQIFHFGTPGILSSKDDAPADKILKRKSKTSNLHGVEKLGLKGFDGFAKDVQAILMIRGGRATFPDFKKLPTVGIGVFKESEVKEFSVILPGTSFAEKNGTLVNFQGREQKLKRAIIPPGRSKPLSEILMMWNNRKATTPGAA